MGWDADGEFKGCGSPTTGVGIDVLKPNEYIRTTKRSFGSVPGILMIDTRMQMIVKLSVADAIRYYC